jgi:hypothetical protein
MARPRKNIEKEKKTSNDVLMTKEEVYDVLQFANSLYNGIYTPNLINSRMQDMTLSPQIADSEKVDEALRTPKSSEQQLLGYSEFFELTNMMYKRMLLYISTMLSFDLTITCTTPDVDYKSSAYKKDLNSVYEFLDKFNIKKEFVTAVKQMLRQEAYFGFLRDDGDKYSFMELPQDYCLIDGRFDYGLLYSFNLYYFYMPGVDIDMFPAPFKKMYRDIFLNNDKMKEYNPAAQIGNRNSQWVLYHQVSPADNFWAFKFSPEIATRIPFLAPIFADVVNAPLVRNLQKNTYIAAASKLLIGKIPMLSKDVKGSAVKDAVAISPSLLGSFLALMKSGLGESIKVSASPLEDMKNVSFPNEEFYQNYLSTTSATSGLNTRLIFSIDKGNAVESQYSMNVDENMISPLYKQFEDFLEFFVNRRLKKHHFKFTLEGTNTFTNRKERLDTQLAIIPFGMINYQKIASAMGILPQDFLRQLAETKAMGFVDNLTPILSSFQAGAGETGRPKKADGSLGDSGAETRGNASNEEK